MVDLSDEFLGWECIIFSGVVLCFAVCTYTCRFRVLQSFARSQILLIFLYSLQNFTFGICMATNSSDKDGSLMRHMQVTLIGTEQFFLLFVIWRAICQYWNAAYNVSKLTKHLQDEKVDLRSVDLMSYRLNYKVKTQFYTNMFAAIIFAFYSILISVSYLRRLLTSATF